MAKRKTLIKKLDSIFSLYIRTRDANKRGICTCCTCNKKLPIKQIHCGHFMSRRHLNTRWDPENTAAQCAGCNTFNQGEQFKFSQFINKKYGEGKAAELLRKSRLSVKLSLIDLQEKYDYYKKLLEELQKKY